MDHYKYLKYKNKYLNIKSSQKGGSKVLFTDNFAKNKMESLIKHLGKPTLFEYTGSGKLESVSWINKLDSSKNMGHFNGLDLIQLINYPTQKLHPEIAPVYVITGKYIHVPDRLIGPLKYASETINIDQLFIPQKHLTHYIKTGKKKVAMVKGSCASVVISSITIKFVEDMVSLHSKTKKSFDQLKQIFRKEYDKRILNYLCGKGVSPIIPWFKPQDFGEEEIYDGKFKSCKK
jgi:hypothetical protein